MFFLFLRTHGELAEWSNAVVLKTIVPKGTGGSNPSLTAKNPFEKMGFFYYQINVILERLIDLNSFLNEIHLEYSNP